MKRICCLLLILFVLNACQTRPSLTPQPTPVLTPVLSSVHLAPTNASAITELATLSDQSRSSIAAVAFGRDAQEMLAVYGREGRLRKWRISDRQLLTTTQVSPSGKVSAAFDKQAERLAIGGGNVSILTARAAVPSYKDVRMWDVKSGDMIFESVPVTMPLGQPTYGIAVNGDGSWVIKVGPGGITGWNVEKDRPDVSIALGGIIGEDPILSELTAVATDVPGQWYAYAQYGGEITVDRRDLFPQLNTAIWRAQVRDSGIPLALDFNTTRTRLAAVANNSVTVWDMQAPFEGTEVFHQSIPTTTLAALTISPDGTLLAIGTDNGWQIRSVTDGRLLIENDEPTYAVAFSPDSRLFAWGDTKGVVHIWGTEE
jgi:WD40 repeat protein